jgi:hypothetical protein
LRDAPTGGKIQELYIQPQYIYVFCIYLRKYSDVFPYIIPTDRFYSRDEKYLLRGTNWVFK